MAILAGLVEKGASVRAFDPAALRALSRDPRPGVTYCESEYSAAEGASALVLATEWNQFRSLDLDRLKRLLSRPLIVDLRNIYEPEAMREKGFDYVCVGR